jgi:hypothetical protein
LRAPPRRSGSEPVGAATMPPVRTLDGSFTVISARSIASRYGPCAALQADQSRQNACVSPNDAYASSTAGGPSYERA